MTKFLGGTQKSWMIGHQIWPNHTSRHTNSRSITNHIRPDNVTGHTVDTLSGIHQAAASYESQALQYSDPAARWVTSPPSYLQASMSIANATSTLSKDLDSAADTVLPSPAPSDEPRQGSVHAVDLLGEREGQEVQHQSGQQAQVGEEVPNTDRLSVLIKHYGGVNELERRLRDDGSRNDSPVSFSTEAASGSLQDAPGMVVRKRTQQNESISRKRAHPTPSSVSETSSRSSIAPAISRVPLALPTTPEWNQPHAATLSFKEQISRRVEAIGSQKGSSIEIPRLGLLQDACDCLDFFYLIIHQLFCLGPNSLAASPQLAHGFNSDHAGGVMILDRLLLPNTKLDDDAVTWFSGFPRPLMQLLEAWPILHVTHEKVLACLAKLPQFWYQVRNNCQYRYYPPLVDEMIDILGVDSIVLQRVISRAILRDIWLGLHDECYVACEKLFFQNQHAVQARQSLVGTPQAITQAKILSYNQSLAIEYQRLWAQHQGHFPQQLQNQQTTQKGDSRVQAINTSMAPPQQSHSHIASTRNTMSSQDLSRPSLLSSNARPAPPLSINTPSTILGSTNSLERPSVVPSSPSSATPLSPFLTRGVPTPFYPPGSHPQSMGVMLPSNVQYPQHSQSSSMILGSNVQDSPTAIHTQMQGMQKQDRSITGRRERPQVQSNGPRRGRPSLESIRVATSSPGTALSGVSCPSQLDVQLVPQYYSPTHSIQRQAQDFSPTSYSNMYVSGNSNGPHTIPNSTQIQDAAGLNFEAPMPQQLRPPRGYFRSTADPPAQGSTALHQAQARSPILVAVDDTGNSISQNDFFGFVKGLSVMPNRLSTVKRHFKWSFEVRKESSDLLASEVSGPNGAPPTRMVRPGTLLCRIRCIKVKGDTPVTESEWVVTDNTWPNGVALLLNGTALEIRRKIHHGKDLSIDVTKHLREGNNTFSIATTTLRQDDQVSFELGLETIEITDSTKIKEAIAKLDGQESLRRILAHPPSIDPDIEVVDATVLLDLTDPHTARIFNIPVRGRTCRHNQCFDLDVFLQTRIRKTPNHPSSPDHFKCPICGADARPQSLVMDLFFMKVRIELERMKRLDVKTVMLDEQGTWKIKEDEEVVREPSDGSGIGRLLSSVNGPSATSARSETSQVPNTSEVVEID